MAWSGADFGAGVAAPRDLSSDVSRQRGAPALPAYLCDVYRWAYLDRANARLLDHDAIVAAILLGNHRRLRRALISEIAPGQHVLQAAHVYGCLVQEIARRVGTDGRLDVVEVAPLQAALCRRKLSGLAQARVRLADAAEPGPPAYDVVSCFFLLHEMPDAKKRAVVDALLARVAPRGKAVFIDYHEPASWHPLRWPLGRMFDRVEPFARSLWRHEVRHFATDAAAFSWEKETLFGGVYQRVIARRS